MLTNQFSHCYQYTFCSLLSVTLSFAHCHQYGFAYCYQHRFCSWLSVWVLLIVISYTEFCSLSSVWFLLIVISIGVAHCYQHRCCSLLSVWVLLIVFSTCFACSTFCYQNEFCILVILISVWICSWYQYGFAKLSVWVLLSFQYGFLLIIGWHIYIQFQLFTSFSFNRSKQILVSLEITPILIFISNGYCMIWQFFPRVHCILRRPYKNFLC